jgi:SOS response regulatory protein OraA/RecX
MAERGYGDYYIRTYLERLEIPCVLIDKALKKIGKDFDEEKRILMLVQKRKGLERQKMMRFLAGRGFPYERISNVLGGVDE